MAKKQTLGGTPATVALSRAGVSFTTGTRSRAIGTVSLLDVCETVLTLEQFQG